MQYNGVFETSTLALAAYLHSQSHALINVRRGGNGEKTIFQFRNSGTLQARVHAFRLGDATGNINLYERSRQHLVWLIKNPTQTWDTPQPVPQPDDI